MQEQKQCSQIDLYMPDLDLLSHKNISLRHLACYQEDDILQRGSIWCIAEKDTHLR